MDKRTRAIMGGIFVIILCTIGFVIHQWNLRKAEKIVTAAERLYPLLADADFDGIEIYESENRISLYKYIKKSEQSSVLVRKEIASLSLDDASIQDAQLFKNIMDYCGGIFFATNLNWNAEWSGLCLYPSDPSLLPSQYISHNENEYAYWLSDIPNSIVN